MNPRRRVLVGLLATPFATACRARVGAHKGPSPLPETLRVMTLNLAHGRGRALSQSNARPAEWFRRNLDAVALVLRRERPAVVALQEAELGSRWAGDFDHVRYLADRSGMSYAHATPHMNEPPRFRYGTALLSRYPFNQASGGTFSAGGRWNKGWTDATIEAAGVRLRMVSVHLDFARAQRRARQVAELESALREREEPLVVMGDFNSTWSDSNRSAIAVFASALDLRAYAPEHKLQATFGRRRIDWIVVAAPLQIAQRHVLANDLLSDHRGVVADLSIHAGRDSHLHADVGRQRRR